MSISISNQKAQLRRKSKAIRNELDNGSRQEASNAICKHLSAWDILQKSDVILTYMPMRTEVDLRPLFAEFPEKHWLIPRILPGEEGRMDFHTYDPNSLIQHPFGMAEPAPNSPKLLPGEIQLVLVPGLAFDHFGWRLGYGGGYYDRFLVGFKGESVGITFWALLLDTLPHGEYDIPVGWVLSENGMQPCYGK